MRFLSQEWLDRQLEVVAALPTADGLSARIRCRVSGGPDGDVTWVTVVAGGVATASRCDDHGDVDVELTATHADAVAMATGELDLSVAFMQGRLKVNGSMAAVLPWVPITRTPAFDAAMAGLVGETEF